MSFPSRYRAFLSGFASILGLLTAQISNALPLRIGNTWTWRIEDPRWQQVDSVTATVIASSPHDSGIAWTLLINPSNTEYEPGDSNAVVLERPDGSQSWLIPKEELRIELQPWNGQEVKFQYQPNDSTPIPMPWGSVSSCYRAGSGGQFSISRREGGPSNASTFCQIFESAGSRPIKRQIWIDSLQLLVLKPLDNSQFYRPIRFNHRPIELPPESRTSLTPSIGSTIVWEESISSSINHSDSPFSIRTYLHQWKVVENSLDTSGSTHLKVSDSVLDDSGRITYSVRNFEYKLDQWESSVYLGICPTPEDSWIRHWSDSVMPTGVVRTMSFYHQSCGAGCNSNSIIAFERISPNSQMDSVSCTEDSLDVIYTKKVTTRTLISVDGKTVRTPTIATAVLPGKPRYPSSHKELAARYPALLLRWTKPSGATGSIQAVKLVEPGGFPLHGLIYLDARLPNGKSWAGTIIAP